MHKIIPVAGPSITEKEISYVTDAVKNGWYEHANNYIERFESAFKNYLGRKYAISLPSCTSALHLSLLALGVGPGDEIIVPDATWIASVAPVIYVGATPIFADMDSNSWCISTESVSKLISKKTKAIIAVNLYGQMPDYDGLNLLGIPIIEDAAESVGSKYKDKLSGNFGVTSCFSFHGSKTLVTGEGGMLVTDDENIYDKCMILRDHGRKPGDYYFKNIIIGYKYKMSNLQAALGLAQLERVNELVDRKKEIFNYYTQELCEIENITLNPNQNDVENSYWMSTILFDKSIQVNKFELVDNFMKQGVSTRPFFSPLSSIPATSKMTDTKRARQFNNVAYDICENGLNLPSAYSVQLKDVQKVKGIINRILFKGEKLYDSIS